jgi:hypothetical protein
MTDRDSITGCSCPLQAQVRRRDDHGWQSLSETHALSA